MMLLLADGINAAIDKGLVGVLGAIIVGLLSALGWLWRERVAMEKAHREEMKAADKAHREEVAKLNSERSEELAKLHTERKEEMTRLQAECKEEILQIAGEYRDKTEALLREQVQTVTQVVESNNKVLREAAEAVRRSRGRAS